MAAFRCADFISPATLLPSYLTGKRISVKIIRCSSVSIPNRKNYLRPKILRTLNPKPLEIESPEIFPPRDVISKEEDGVEELQVSSSEVSGVLSKLSPKLVVKYGLCLVGIFAFQTVFAVLFLGNSTNSEKKPENSSDSLKGGNEGRLLSNVGLLDEIEMNERIAEIRVMAREARKSEEKSVKKEEKDEALKNPGGGIDIEREIEARLSNMEKRLNSQRKGLAGLRVEPLDDESRKNDEKSLIFEKKYKFKGEKPLMGNVKGFGGSKGNNGNVSDSRDGEKVPEEKLKDDGHVDSKMVSGGAQESNEVKKPRNSGNQVSGKPNMEAGSGFGKTKRGEIRKGKPMRSARENANKMWWLKLPYVLRILMRSNIDEEVSEGYFTLRTESTEQNEDQVSHIIAFEDQNDARNFSYLLESVFEDLDDFSADVVPISTKDLYDEVSSGGKNVIVVKKKQLTLYAGQPFEDVERALHTIIQEQS